VLSYHISVLLDTAVIEEINSETTGYEAKQWRGSSYEVEIIGSQAEVWGHKWTRTFNGSKWHSF
jgi:hypothetical protein